MLLEPATDTTVDGVWEEERDKCCVNEASTLLVGV